MQIIKSIKQMQHLSRQLKKQNKKIGFVPTMGYLHLGHLSLIREARAENDFLVVSIFVNPTQFGPTEDFDKYPRDFKRDRNLAGREKVDCIFYPRKEDVYFKDCRTFVYVEDLSDCLCGLSRPGHFKGVATVIAKLFNIIDPDVAYFGQKDAQQAIIIKRMVRDLNFPVKIKVLPTVRKKGGLALSSRNKYLSSKEKREARVLYASLKKAGNLFKKGIRDADRIRNIIFKMINNKKTARLEYIEIVNTKSLEPVKKIKSGTLIAIACRFGQVRLIDNIII